MDVRLLGTGGRDGWPQPGCNCASCGRARLAASCRAPGRVLVDEVLEIAPGAPPAPADRAGRVGSHRVVAVPGGWDVTAPDGARLLTAAGPGAVPRPPDGAAAYDIALLDLLEWPAQLGELRARGLVRDHCAVAALYADHRVTSAAELARRCLLWGVAMPADGMTLTSPAAGPGEGGPGAGERPPRGRILLLGGARSGKSSEAQLRLAAEPRVTYLAAGPWGGGARGADPRTGSPQAGDPAACGSRIGPDGTADAEWAQRVAAHRATRPPWWRTVESADVAGMLRHESGALLIDGMGTWLAAVMEESGVWAENPLAGQAIAGRVAAGRVAGPPGAEERIADRVADLIAAWRQTTAHVVAVSDQVGSGVHPATRAGRMFRDQLGWLNQRLAAESEQTLLVVAGRVTILPS